MKTLLKAALLAAGLLATGGPALGKQAAAQLVDCPLRDEPYSTNSPVIDILLNPAARDLTGMKLPAPGDTSQAARALSTTPPTFAAILTMKEAAGFTRQAAPDYAALDAALAKIPVTRADKIARCARYDTVPPRFVLPQGRPRILLFEKINGFRDGPSVDAAHAAFVAMAQRKGWAIVTTQNGAAFTPGVLRQFDAVIWNNISGDVLTLTQRRAFRAWMENGGGFIGIHGSAGDPAYFWDWYVDGLIGARFLSHPMDPQFQTARVKIDEAAHPIAQGLPSQWEMNDEWYSFKNNPRTTGSRIIATLDESTYKPMGRGNMDLKMGDHPIAWTRCIGANNGRVGSNRGRMFYSAIGHRPERYSDAIYVQMLEQGVAWATNKAGCQSAR
jgi:type 1 glutamine amidotransferase